MISWKVYTVCAYSGVWKSNFTYSYVVDALKRGKKVIFFSLEVQADMLMANLVKASHNITIDDIRKDSFMWEYDVELFENLTIYDDASELTEICSITEQEEPDIIFIDFIQNVKTDWFGETEKLDKIAKRLQELAIRTNSIVFNVSQSNNESKFKPANEQTPKWSGTIYQSTDILITLARNWNGIDLCVLKNKFWQSFGMFDLDADFARLQFKVERKLEENNIWGSDFSN
jgi:replicative DNA helicase